MYFTFWNESIMKKMQMQKNNTIAKSLGQHKLLDSILLPDPRTSFSDAVIHVT